MTALPADVEVRALLPEGVRYILPRRDTGDLPAMGRKTLWVGLLIAAIGLSLCGVGMWRAVGQPWYVWVVNPLAMFGVLIAFGGVVLAGIGLLIAYGHAEILLDRDFVTARERAGLLRWNWKRSVKIVNKLEVTTALVNPRQERSRNLYRIAAGDIFLAPGFPREWCMALADDLRSRWPSEGSDGSSNPRPQCILTAPEPLVPPPAVERTSQPIGSRVVVDETRDALTFNIPPVGIWKGSKGLFAFALVWNVLLVGAAILWYVLLRGKRGDDLIFVETIVGFSAAIGVAILLSAINMGRRRAAIATSGDRLMIVQLSLFGRKRQEWSRAEIIAIVAGSSGIQVNNVAATELQVYSADGVFGVLAGRENEELEWMATLLRRRLRIAAPENKAQSA